MSEHQHNFVNKAKIRIIDSNEAKSLRLPGSDEGIWWIIGQTCQTCNIMKLLPYNLPASFTPKLLLESINNPEIETHENWVGVQIDH